MQNLETPKLDGPGTLRRARVMEIAEIINSGTSHGQRCPEGIWMLFTNVVNSIKPSPIYRALFLSIQYTHIWDDYMLSVTIDLGYGMVNVLGASGESSPQVSGWWNMIIYPDTCHVCDDQLPALCDIYDIHASTAFCSHGISLPCRLVVCFFRCACLTTWRRHSTPRQPLQNRPMLSSVPRRPLRWSIGYNLWASVGYVY